MESCEIAYSVGFGSPFEGGSSLTLERESLPVPDRAPEKFETVKGFSVDRVIEEFESLSKDAEEVQRETLEKILEENGAAEYLQRLGLAGRTDPQSFKSCVPLVTHKDLEPYIQRIIDGDASPILTGKPITSISLSSGTTQGKPKFVPFNEELVQFTMQIYRTSFAYRNSYVTFNRAYPIGNGKALQFIYGSKQFEMKGGLMATTATTNVYRSEQFKHTMKDICSQCCSPDEVIFSPDYHQSLYCHLLCGLIFAEEVQFVFSTFAHSIIHAFRTFELVWEELCHDIREGELSHRITIPSIRAAVSRLLRPNPQLADNIYSKCSRLSGWYGVIPEIWPNAKYVYGIMTGSMEPYLNKLRHYAGCLPLMSADYGASEGWIGANIDPEVPPESATFAVLPNIGYFEFIPLKKGAELQQKCESAEPIGLTEVKIGEEYEIIITTFAGLYRYKLGDVVKVAGFHNSTPKLQFVRRESLILTINIDKNTEKDLQLAIEEAGMLLADEKLEIFDFTSHVDMSTEPGHYVIFLELSGDIAKEELLSNCCNCLDLAFVDAGYVGSRKVRAIGPLELRVVHRGTFHKIMDHYLNLGSAMSQYKTPRCVNLSNSSVLQILNSNVLGSYFSTAYNC
ncbi:putative indole-3-acetic acid-amido synthetase GH3.5 [Apostasia shenzhenica]|uniref:Putative indole-3-acetic acid-amido synthetase GH3.5 n=1 Tax=Apostasia shenzhenica TaxID=1088818 RepID=A0A2I0ATT8_9ASPA|nr:putative indole-3-acetic acid-amido synthetase GH3.5 [Apostasia shenzhenica]